MPKKPKGEKRPADVIGNAVCVMQIATGETDEECEQGDSRKDQAAQALGRKGSKPRSDSMKSE